MSDKFVFQIFFEELPKKELPKEELIKEELSKNLSSNTWQGDFQWQVAEEVQADV